MTTETITALESKYGVRIYKSFRSPGGQMYGVEYEGRVTLARAHNVEDKCREAVQGGGAIIIEEQRA